MLVMLVDGPCVLDLATHDLHFLPGVPPGALGQAGTVDQEGARRLPDAEGGGISRPSATGTLLQRAALPFAAPAACCFGGPGLRSLFISTRRKEATSQPLWRFSRPGGIFRVRSAVAGRPVPRFHPFAQPPASCGNQPGDAP